MEEVEKICDLCHVIYSTPTTDRMQQSTFTKKQNTFVAN